MIRPSATAPNGRRADGCFAAGNRLAKGNPHARQVARLRSALLEAVSPEDMREIVAKLVEQAKAGDVQAAREVLTRTLGRPQEADFQERLEQLEELLREARAGGGR